MLRIAIAFLLGVGCTLLALREIPPLNKNRKIEARIGRYQIVHGSMPFYGFDKLEEIKAEILLDTSTGKTWHLGIDENHSPVWHVLAQPSEQ